MNNHIKTSSGFTLVEVLLALAISAAAVLIASQGFLLIFKTNDRQEAALEVLGEGRDMLFALGENIRGADAIISPLEGETGSIMTLEHASTSITFEAGGGTLWMTEGASEPLQISGKNVVVTALLVKRLSGETPSMKIDLTVASKKSDATGEAYQTETFTDTFVVRKH